MAGDPVVAYDSIGNLFYINMYGDPILGAKAVRSSTNGLAWETPVIAASGNDKCWLACDQTNGPFSNYVYVCMSNNGTGYFSRSRDHGQTFENTINFPNQTVPGMSVCVGPYNYVQGGSVIVVTNSGDAFASTYTFYRSLNGGSSFTLMSSQQFSGYVGANVNGRNSVEGMRTRPYPYIAADNSYGPNRGRLYCVYATNDPPGNGYKPDVWCRYSTNGGTTWSAAVRVNDDVNPQSNHQYHPAIWCDKSTGKLYVQWMDTRDTPTHDSAYIYGTFSDDGGMSFKTNQRISNQKMKIDCPSCGGSGTPRYQGDYNGIVSNKKGAMAGWTDFRNGTFMSVTSYFPDFAMALDKTADSLFAPSDSIDVVVSVPGVKLYADTVLLSGSVTPSPAPRQYLHLVPIRQQDCLFSGIKDGKDQGFRNCSVGLLHCNYSGRRTKRNTCTQKIVDNKAEEHGIYFCFDQCNSPGNLPGKHFPAYCKCPGRCRKLFLCLAPDNGFKQSLNKKSACLPDGHHDLPRLGQ